MYSGLCARSDIAHSIGIRPVHDMLFDILLLSKRRLRFSDGPGKVGDIAQWAKEALTVRRELGMFRRRVQHAALSLTVNCADKRRTHQLKCPMRKFDIDMASLARQQLVTNAAVLAHG